VIPRTLHRNMRCLFVLPCSYAICMVCLFMVVRSVYQRMFIQVLHRLTYAIFSPVLFVWFFLFFEKVILLSYCARLQLPPPVVQINLVLFYPVASEFHL
jgi:hypothetical protein